MTIIYFLFLVVTGILLARFARYIGSDIFKFSVILNFIRQNLQRFFHNGKNT
jgi:hypothetical protein